LTKRQAERIKHLAGDEVFNPVFRRAKCRTLTNDAQAEALMRGAILIVADRLGIRISFDEASKRASLMVHNPFDNWRSSLCLMPGWHTNSAEDDKYWRNECALQLFGSVARELLRSRRHWWRHPRWHFWHWKLQVHPWQRWKRRRRGDSGYQQTAPTGAGGV
jgi:hypothetical protein